MNADVYDGKVWKEWEAKPKTENQTWFAKDSGDIALQLNVDAFQPFEKVQYSMTAVFVAILCLPMEIRYKQENIILLALLPGNYNCIYSKFDFLFHFHSLILIFSFFYFIFLFTVLFCFYYLLFIYILYIIYDLLFIIYNLLLIIYYLLYYYYFVILLFCYFVIIFLFFY